jgi:hypothetical protein
MRIVLLMLFLVVVLAGCNGITADTRHAALLDSTAAWAQAISIRANTVDVCDDCVGQFTNDQVKALLKSNAALWLYFDQAKDGAGAMPPPPVGE